MELVGDETGGWESGSGDRGVADGSESWKIEDEELYQIFYQLTISITSSSQ